MGVVAETRLPAQRISHAAALVPDVDASISLLEEMLGWGPWRVYELVPPRLDRRVYRGEDGAFGMIGAETHVGEVDFALNQSLRGPSIYTEFLARRGHGLHHLACMSTAGAQDLRARFAAAGVGVAMAGRIDETIEFMYFDSEPTLGVAIEAGTGHAITLRPDRQHALGVETSKPAVFAEIAIVVRDLDTSVEAYATLLGWGPWEIAEEVEHVRVSGEPIRLRRRLAWARVGPLELQLVQPLAGASPEQAALDAGAEGLHHIGCLLDHRERGRIERLLHARNVSRSVTGEQNGREFWYVEALPRLKLIFT